MKRRKKPILFGEDLFGKPANQRGLRKLCRDFGAPPFSVLDTRQKYWQDRKRAWIGLGITSEIGREDMGNKAYNDMLSKKKMSDRSLSTRVCRGKEHYWAIVRDSTGKQTGISIFDPVLTELVYSWFCPPNGRVLDPFCGGSVRGVVAASLHHPYCGMDLSQRQVTANRRQGIELVPELLPDWRYGDAIDVRKMFDGKFDCVFSCPPYADLEVYSDDARDISNMPYEDFLVKYRAIIKECSRSLYKNRFACFVVGDVRDRETGYYHNLPGDTIQAFEDCGLHLYNHAILVQAVGSLPIRAGRNFQLYRKLGNGHQHVLVFWKGESDSWKILKEWDHEDHSSRKQKLQRQKDDVGSNGQDDKKVKRSNRS